MYLMTQIECSMYTVTKRTDQKRNKEKEVFKSKETIAIAVSLAINDGMQLHSTVGSTPANIHIMTAKNTKRFYTKSY